MIAVMYSNSNSSTPLVCTLKNFTAFLYARVFVTVSFTLNIIRQGKEPILWVETVMRLLWCAPALPVNVSLGWKWLTWSNTLAYYGMEFITAVIFLLHRTLLCGLYYKHITNFMMIIIVTPQFGASLLSCWIYPRGIIYNPESITALLMIFLVQWPIL